MSAFNNRFIGMLLFSSILFIMCDSSAQNDRYSKNYLSSNSSEIDTIYVQRAAYIDKLAGFWLGQCIANWTGLVTEMDKIGNIGEIKTGSFYTRNDWGKPDLPSIWGEGIPSNLSETIDFVYADTSEIWGSDDDTDIEYMYQFLMHKNATSILSAQQISDGWLTHIKKEEENYLWVSNQTAFDLMQQGVLPPSTSEASNNPHTAMIDAQLTTELFGLFAPIRTDVAFTIADLPIRVTASNEAASIAHFYVNMHSLAAYPKEDLSTKDKLYWMAQEARTRLNDNEYPAKMFDFIDSLYQQQIPWEEARDLIYQRYQVEQLDGYTITSQNLYCNGCFAAGINFAASLISLFWGEGSLKETIKIGTLCGWDSDNPTATWGGLLGFMMGQQKIEDDFGIAFSTKFSIHRTRQNFPNNGIDHFENMAKVGLEIIDRCVIEEMNGRLDTLANIWAIPIK